MANPIDVRASLDSLPPSADSVPSAQWGERIVRALPTIGWVGMNSSLAAITLAGFFVALCLGAPIVGIPSAVVAWFLLCHSPEVDAGALFRRQVTNLAPQLSAPASKALPAPSAPAEPAVVTHRNNNNDLVQGNVGPMIASDREPEPLRGHEQSEPSIGSQAKSSENTTLPGTNLRELFLESSGKPGDVLSKSQDDIAMLASQQRPVSQELSADQVNIQTQFELQAVIERLEALPKPKSQPQSIVYEALISPVINRAVLMSNHSKLRENLLKIAQELEDTLKPFNEAIASTGISPNNLKNRDFNKEGSQIFYSEQETITERQDSSKNEEYETKPTQPKTDSSDCFSIEPQQRPTSETLLPGQVQEIANAQPQPTSAAAVNAFGNARVRLSIEPKPPKTRATIERRSIQNINPENTMLIMDTSQRGQYQEIKLRDKRSLRKGEVRLMLDPNTKVAVFKNDQLQTVKLEKTEAEIIRDLGLEIDGSLTQEKKKEAARILYNNILGRS